MGIRHCIHMLKVCNLCRKARFPLCILNIFHTSHLLFAQVNLNIYSPTSLTISTQQCTVYFLSPVSVHPIFFLIAHTFTAPCFHISLTLIGINCFKIATWVSVYLRPNNDRCVFKLWGVILGGSRGGDGLVEKREFTTLTDHPTVFNRALFILFFLELVSPEKGWKIWTAGGERKRENTIKYKRKNTLGLCP